MRKVLLIVVSGVVAVAVLTVIGVEVRSDWSSFIPDVIVGVIGAGAIAALISFTTWQVQRRDALLAETTSAYNELLQSVTDLRGADLVSPKGKQAGDAIRRMNVRMVVLSECIDRDKEVLANWFEAERQLATHRALAAAAAVAELEQDDELHGVDDVIDAEAPLLRWTAEFTNNLRYWRTGKVKTSELVRQAESIEAALRAERAWHEPFSWRRDDSEAATE